ncbi:hypothetical protein D3C73_1329030 [compost metagenome]
MADKLINESETIKIFLMSNNVIPNLAFSAKTSIFHHPFYMFVNFLTFAALLVSGFTPGIKREYSVNL